MSPDRAGISRTTHDAYPLRRQVRSPVGRVLAISAWVAAGAVIVAGIAAESLPLALGGLVAWVLAMGAVNVAGGALTVVRDRELDERELRERERGFALAHRAMTVVLMLTFLAVPVAAGDSPDRAGLMALLAGLFLVQLAGPSLLLSARARLEGPDDA